MADFGAPVVNPNANPIGQSVQTLSGLLNIQQQKQGIQLNQQAIAGGAADLQQKQQQMQERLGIQKMMSTGIDDQGNSIKGADGNPDVAKVLPALGRIAPLTGQQYAQQIIKTHSDNIGLQASSASLDANERAMLMAPVQAAALDPNAKAADVNAGIDNLVAAHPEMGNAATYLKGLVGHLDTVDPKHRSMVVQQIAARMQGGQAVQTQPTAGGVNDGATQSQGAFAPPVAGGGFTPATQVANKVGPGAVPVQDAFGRPSLVNPQDGSTRPIGGPGFTQPVAGQQQVMDSVENARAAGDQAPMMRNINQQLLQLSDKTATGPWSQNLHKIAAAVGLPSGAQYQEIGAYLDRQAAAQARTMGVPNTNAGLQASERAAGTTDYARDALQEKVKFADALNTGAMAYRQGLDKAVGTGATPDLSKYQAFRSAWAQNFDPDVFRVDDAQRRGDKAELTALKQRLGPQAMQVLATKSANLRQLENGQIPQ